MYVQYCVYYLFLNKTVLFTLYRPWAPIFPVTSPKLSCLPHRIFHTDNPTTWCLLYTRLQTMFAALQILRNHKGSNNNVKMSKKGDWILHHQNLFYFREEKYKTYTSIMIICLWQNALKFIQSTSHLKENKQ